MHKATIEPDITWTRRSQYRIFNFSRRAAYARILLVMNSIQNRTKGHNLTPIVTGRVVNFIW